jgi:hypothetical protein
VRQPLIVASWSSTAFTLSGRSKFLDDDHYVRRRRDDCSGGDGCIHRERDHRRENSGRTLMPGA